MRKRKPRRKKPSNKPLVGGQQETRPDCLAASAALGPCSSRLPSILFLFLFSLPVYPNSSPFFSSSYSVKILGQKKCTFSYYSVECSLDSLEYQTFPQSSLKLGLVNKPCSFSFFLFYRKNPAFLSSIAVVHGCISRSGTHVLRSH